MFISFSGLGFLGGFGDLGIWNGATRGSVSILKKKQSTVWFEFAKSSVREIER